MHLGHGYIALSRTIYFQLPANPVAYSVFQDMAFQGDRREIRDFLKLSKGCRTFVDAGASGGFFSVLFSASRTERCTVLSIEPDPGARAVLSDTRARNVRETISWLIEDRGVSDHPDSVRFVSSGYGVEPVSTRALQNASKCAVENNLTSTISDITCVPLEAILLEREIVPDLIKIDIESFEYELINSSLHLLSKYKPRLMLELHIEMLRDRGLSPDLILRALRSLGYRAMGRRDCDLLAVLRAVRHREVVRLGLIAD